MEAAIAVASIVAVVVTCVGAIMAVSLHVRCVDAAREAARAVARGGQASSVLIPDGAVVTVEQREEFVFAQVTADTALPGLTVRGEAVAAMEPGEVP